MNQWKLQDAKAKFSELVDRASAGEAQVVTKHGKKVVAIIAYDQYELKFEPKGLKAWLLDAPKVGEVDITRIQDEIPEIEL